jgi:fibro-slime domain-containing protein
MRRFLFIVGLTVAVIAQSYFSRQVHVLDAVALSVVAMALFSCGSHAVGRGSAGDVARPWGVLAWPGLPRQRTILGLAAAGLVINLLAVSYYARQIRLDDALVLWVLGLILVVLAAAQWDRQVQVGIVSARDQSRSWPWWEVVLLAALILLALFFRLYRIDVMPSGLAEDEAPNILDAIQVLEGQVKTPFASGNWSTSFVFHYVVASLMRLGLSGFYALKTVSIAGGVLAVLFLYLMARRCFHRAVAALAAFFLAVSSWQVINSRLGYLISVEPFLELVIIYFFYRGMQSGRKLDMVLSGLFMGISMIYIRPVSLTPAVLALLVLYRLVLGLREFNLARYVSLSLPFVLGILVFLPRAIYVHQNPQTAISRASEVSLLDSQQWSDQKENPIRAAVTNLKDTVLMFNYRAGYNRRWNVAPFEPAFDSVMATFLILGFGCSLTRWRDPPHFLLLATVAVMLIPPAMSLAIDDRPTTWRAVGLVPAIYTFVAIAVHRTWDSLVRFWPRGKILLAVGVVVLLGYVGWANYWAYFERMANSPDTWYYTGPVETAIGKYLNRLDGHYQIYLDADASRTQAVHGITYGRADYQVIESLDDVPIRDPIVKDLAFVFVSSSTRWSWAGLASLLPRLQYYYPGGHYQEFEGIDGKVLWASYTVSNDEALAAQGLTGRYATGREGAEAVSLVRRDPNLRFSWPEETLPVPVPINASWEGGLFVPDYGVFVFGVAGLLVYVDGALVVDGRAGYREERASLAQGWHALQAQAFVEETSGDAFLAWRRSDEEAMQVIPSEMFSTLPPPSNHGLLGRYYEGESWTGRPIFERLDPVVDFQWPEDQPVPAEIFSTTWHGRIQVAQSGSYRFLTTSDDGSWVYIDNQLVVDNGGRHDARYAEGRIELSAGWHNIEVRYFHADGSREIHLIWAPPGEPPGIVPSSVLDPPVSRPLVHFVSKEASL